MIRFPIGLNADNRVVVHIRCRRCVKRRTEPHDNVGWLKIDAGSNHVYNLGRGHLKSTDIGSRSGRTRIASLIGRHSRYRYSRPSRGAAGEQSHRLRGSTVVRERAEKRIKRGGGCAGKVCGNPALAAVGNADQIEAQGLSARIASGNVGANARVVSSDDRVRDSHYRGISRIENSAATTGLTARNRAVAANSGKCERQRARVQDAAAVPGHSCIKVQVVPISVILADRGIADGELAGV